VNGRDHGPIYGGILGYAWKYRGNYEKPVRIGTLWAKILS
jgi:hypothetical protein